MRILRSGDSEYPPLLRTVAPRPTLWVRGEIVADDALAIAIVGSRNATDYGLQQAEGLAADLAARGVTIVSGLARGIDTAAHRGALSAGGRTIAVLGSGVDRIYPPENLRLAGDIERRGAVVSHFPPGMPPLPGHFPARNRVIAGLSLGVVVVEAAEKSGALITASLAGELGREVYAIPGRVNSTQSRGANGLLQDGAKLVQVWTDVVQELPETWRRLIRDVPSDPGDANRPAALRGAQSTERSSEHGRVMNLLRPDEPQHIEDLIDRSGLPVARLAAVLLALELDGRARQLAGQRWLAAGRQTARREA